MAITCWIFGLAITDISRSIIHLLKYAYTLIENHFEIEMFWIFDVFNTYMCHPHRFGPLDVYHPHTLPPFVITKVLTFPWWTLVPRADKACSEGNWINVAKSTSKLHSHVLWYMYLVTLSQLCSGSAITQSVPDGILGMLTRMFWKFNSFCFPKHHVFLRNISIFPSVHLQGKIVLNICSRCWR